MQYIDHIIRILLSYIPSSSFSHPIFPHIVCWELLSLAPPCLMASQGDHNLPLQWGRQDKDLCHLYSHPLPFSCSPSPSTLAPPPAPMPWSSRPLLGGPAVMPCLIHPKRDWHGMGLKWTGGPTATYSPCQWNRPSKQLDDQLWMVSGAEWSIILVSELHDWNQTWAIAE